MKLLCISNNLLSLNNANGKFCRNYLSSFKDNELASFYISNDVKAYDEKIDSFNYTDHDVLCDFFHKKHKQIKNKDKHVDSSQSKMHKSSIIRIIRFFVWRIVFKKNKQFKEWLNKIQPTHVILTVGDNPYLFFLSRKIAKKYNCKVIIFCCENYALKDYNYLHCKLHRSVFFRIFQHILKRETIKCFKESSLVVYNSEQLSSHYKKNIKFNRSLVMYSLGSNKYNALSRPENNNIIYAGNLGVGRLETLVEFADILKTVSGKHKLVIYGPADSNQIKVLSYFKNIEYKGYVSNNELTNVLSTGWLSIHVESFDEYRKKDLEYAFSTKISDVVSINDRFFMYAPDCYVESQFFIKYFKNHIATSKEELRDKLKELVNSKNPFSDENNYDVRKVFDISENSNYLRSIILSL